MELTGWRRDSGGLGLLSPGGSSTDAAVVVVYMDSSQELCSRVMLESFFFVIIMVKVVMCKIKVMNNTLNLCEKSLCNNCDKSCTVRKIKVIILY